MKKAIFAIAMAVGMSLPMVGNATADNRQYVLNDNLVQVMGDGIGFANPLDDVKCTIWDGKGTKVRMLGRHGFTGKVTIRVIEGPHNGCEGITDAWNIALAPVQKVFTAGRWGNLVPVFKTRGAYYSARHNMDREGNYRNQHSNVACKLKVGSAVDEFKPFRDWGTGEVKVGNCSGWTDRGVIR